MAVIDQHHTDDYALFNGDCCEVMAELPPNRIGLSIYSPPFGGLYRYSSDERDVSNCVDYDQFFDHYGHVVRGVFRLTMPGRMSVVHCTDVPSGNSGGDHLIDFSGDLIRAHQKEGWRYVARYSVWKEPLGVRNRTMRKDLAHKSIVDDSSRCSCAQADYMLVFRKPGENPEPIEHPTGLMEYYGERTPPAEVLPFRGWTGNQIENRYSHWVWRQYASAFWDDIRIDRVLPFTPSRENGENEEKHVHPLQLDVIDRALVLWSNPNDRVFTPFMGVGSEPHESVRLGRKGIGVELKSTYYAESVKNLASLSVPKVEQPSLFPSLGGA